MPANIVKITGEIRGDCAVWLSVLHSYNGIALLSPLWDISYSHLAFATDASNWGFAAVLHREWFQAQWPPDWVESHINLKEFVPILLALHVWGDNWSHSALTFNCDNQSVVNVISKCTSRDPVMLSIVRAILAFTLPRDLIVHAVHCLGKPNVIADFLSHSQATPAWLCAHNLHKTPRLVPFQVLTSIR